MTAWSSDERLYISCLFYQVVSMLGYLGLMVDLEEKDERNRKEDQLDLSYT